ncbi:uncharacterized protein LOC108732496 [Agrilus planipennis]|uniref:Uncharacterized protein LOC108732496 n=1 Tax=Agrilus planipennis TaxID=224129 RepID=A0A1W4WFH8_AGRPL|nr:uncharacterized protein LOC108732496 [Agrilus planipennis]
MFRQFIAIVVLALISYTNGQYTSPGQCSDRTNLRAVQNFSLERYANNNASWYMVQSNINSDCQILNFALTSNVTVDMVYIQKNSTSGLWFSRRGVKTWVPGNKREGVLSLVYPNVADPFVFKILGIDYLNYSIDYRCINVDGSNKREFLYVMSRRSTSSPALNATIQRIVRANGLGEIQLMHVVQDPVSCSR